MLCEDGKPCGVAVSEIVRSVILTQDQVRREEAERRRLEQRVDFGEVVELRVLAPEAFSPLHRLVLEGFGEAVDWAVEARYRLAWGRYWKEGVLVRLRDGFSLGGEFGRGGRLAQDVELEVGPCSYSLVVFGRSLCVVHLLEVDGVRYLEFGASPGFPLTVAAIIALSGGDLGVFFDALVEYVAGLTPFVSGEVMLAGYREVVERCDVIVEAKDERLMRRHVLLAGPPGCGKSMIARLVAERHPECVRVVLRSGEGWVDLLRLLAEAAGRSSRKVLLIVDDVDELGYRREAGGSVFELLRLMDGAERYGRLTVLATTNRPGVLDGALLRPGRFFPVLLVDPPSRGDMEEILRLYASRYGVELDASVALEGVDDCTGADIRAAVEDLVMRGSAVTSEAVQANLAETLEARRRLSSA